MTSLSSSLTPAASRIHYGWRVVAAGMLCVFAALGIGRFALGMLLPGMGRALGLSYAQMGYVSTANFVGYLLAVLACGRMARGWGSRRLIFSALLLVGGTMLAVSASQGFWGVLILYTITGVGSALANVPTMALVSHWFAPRLRGRAAGFVVIGSGFAIILCGRLIPWLAEVAGEAAWRIGWAGLGGLVLLVALGTRLIIRDRPADLGLQAVGDETPPTASGNAGPDNARPETTAGGVLHMGAIYLMFGASYVIYATFFVTALIQDKGLSEAEAGRLWSWVGGLSLLSGPLFGSLSDRFGRRAVLVAVFCLQTVSYLVVALDLPAALLYFSVICYGIAAWSIPSVMAALVGDRVGPERAAAVFGLVTFIFGIGQVAGPAAAGYLAEMTSSFFWSFLLAAGAASLGALLGLLLPAERPKSTGGGAFRRAP